MYEWHENPSSHERTIGSISTGESSTNDYFLDSSPDGKNVFFGTHSQLVPADKDEQGDLYDARIDGGFPAPIGAGPCEGDACQPTTPLPLFQAPATTTLSSSGDVTGEAPLPPPVVKKKTVVKCAKPKKLEHGKCVKPKKQARAKKAGHNGKAKR